MINNSTITLKEDHQLFVFSFPSMVQLFPVTLISMILDSIFKCSIGGQLLLQYQTILKALDNARFLHIAPGAPVLLNTYRLQTQQPAQHIHTVAPGPSPYQTQGGWPYNCRRSLWSARLTHAHRRWNAADCHS